MIEQSFFMVVSIKIMSHKDIEKARNMDAERLKDDEKIKTPETDSFRGFYFIYKGSRCPVTL